MAFLFELISIVIYGTMLYPLRTWFIFVKDWRKGEKIPVYWHYLWFVFQLPILGAFIRFLPEGANLASGEDSVVFFGLLLAYIGAGAYQIDRKRYVPKENIYHFDKTDGLYVWLCRLLWILPLYIYLFLAYVVNIHPIDFLAYLAVFAFWERSPKVIELGKARKKKRLEWWKKRLEWWKEYKKTRPGKIAVVAVVAVVVFGVGKTLHSFGIFYSGPTGDRHGIKGLVSEAIWELVMPMLLVVVAALIYYRARKKN